MSSYFNEHFPKDLAKVSCSLFLDGNNYVTNLEEGLSHFISFCLSKNNIILRTRQGKKVIFYVDENTKIEIKLATAKLAVDLEYSFNSWLIEDLVYKFVRFDS